jgi:hypothetical protein
MYVAKQTNSGHAAFDPRMARTGEHGLSLLSDLRRAVDERPVLPAVTSPRISLDDRPLPLGRGADPLAPSDARLRAARPVHPVRGADGLHQVDHPLGARGRACASSRNGARRASTSSLNVNISTRDLVQQDLPALVRAQLLAEGVAARHLCLEVTESAIMQDPRTRSRRCRRSTRWACSCPSTTSAPATPRSRT